MSRNVLIALSFLLIGVLACNAPGSGSVAVTEVVLPPTPTTAQPTPSAAPATTQPTQGPGDNPGAVDVPDTDEPVFFGPIQYTDNANAVVGFTEIGQGVKQVWAIWHYANMRQGLTVRRVWTKDGEVWIEKEEAWDFAKYGVSGIVRDISIYDFEAGLEPGSYLLTLYIDSKEQALAQSGDVDGFTIVAGDGGSGAASVEFPSPDGTRTAFIEKPGTLKVGSNASGAQTIDTAPEIIEVEWFPDSQHLLYVTLDRGDAPQGPTFNWVWEMWIADVTTLDTWAIAGADDEVHDAAISPDGSVIAVIRGNGYGDAGVVGQALGFMYMDTNFRPSGPIVMSYEFDGIPPNTGGIVYPSQTDSQPLPGEWVSPTEFHALMAHTFQQEDFEDGIYAFFILERIAERVGDLPADAHP